MKVEGKSVGTVIGLVAAVILLAGVSYVVTAGVTCLIAWCFEVCWSWRIALGVWLSLLLLGSSVNVSTRHKG